MLRFYKISIVYISIIMFTCCGGENKNRLEQSQKPQTVEITISADDKMKFDQEKIVVNEGDFVIIKLVNIGRMSKRVMGHNFVLLTPNTDPAKFAAKALSAKENEYIPEDKMDNIIVYSRLLGPGEEAIIEFTAPAKGLYKYICSFPGHYISMQGSLIVR